MILSQIIQTDIVSDPQPECGFNLDGTSSEHLLNQLEATYLPIQHMNLLEIVCGTNILRIDQHA